MLLTNTSKSNLMLGTFSDKCSRPNLWYHSFEDLNEKEVKFLPWLEGEPNGELTHENCVYAENHFYADLNCNMDHRCFPCKIHQEAPFRLRGLCQGQADLDTDYILLRSSIRQGEIVFQGLLKKSLIRLNRSNGSWDLKTIQNETEALFGTLPAANQLPVGLKTWSLKSNCNKPDKVWISIELKFTKAIFYQLLRL